MFAKVCRPCAIIGVVLLMYAGTAWAESGARGPDWQTIALGAVGMSSAMIAAYAKGLQSSIARAEEELDDLRTLVYRDYGNKVDTERLINSGVAALRAEIQSTGREVTAIHRRLNRMKAPHDE